jgi:hypothetical protein
MCSQFHMQEEDIVKLINAKCHLYTLSVNLKIIVQRRHTPQNTIKHIHAKIFVSALEHQVS